MRRGFFLVVGSVALSFGLGLFGCGDDVKNNSGGGSSQSTTSSTGTAGSGAGGGAPASIASTVDLLLMVDNSRSMADKQLILASTVPDLVLRLVNPRCVDAGGQPAPTQPAGPLEDCSAGSTREFQPVLDMHIGIISSSLGGHGSDSCPDMSSTLCPSGSSTSNNDKGHLLARADPCSPQEIPTYQNKGFLAWDPTGTKDMPPGETNVDNLIATLTDMVVGVGQIGCGYESQLESWYRFLVDPNPYESISVVSSSATPQGTDSLLLTQRADFLRPNSLLAILMLTDEDDCSTIEGGQYYFANQQKNGDGSEFHLPKARSACANDPNDACCKSCGQGVPDGCAANDPACTPGPLTKIEDNINLRCWDQKRRFGIDFLYPVQRYVNALTKIAIDPTELTLEGGSAVPNPIFSDLNPSDANSAVRAPDLVVLGGIVGVPWQDIARDPADLAKGYKTSAEIDWALILGDPASYVPPADPHMIESIDPRPGLSDPNDPIHGHEYTISKRDDLQYACIFDLPTPRDCTDVATIQKGCDCADTANDSPLCAVDPSTGAPTTQVKAKAYPGQRPLGVLKGLGAQGVVASICPANVVDSTAPAFGYRPGVAAFLDVMKPHLAKP